MAPASVGFFGSALASQPKRETEGTRRFSQVARPRRRPLRVQEIMCGLFLTFETDYRSERRFVFISETRLSLVAWPTELSSCVSTRSRLSFISLTRRTKWQTWMFGLAKVPLIAISSFLVSYQLLIYCSVSLCFIYC